MAKSKKSQGYQDPLDSIFGMIFSGAKSKPVRTKPIKYTGYSASKELAQALAEIAAKPANYVSEGALTAVNDGLNQVNLVQFQLDSFDEDLRKGDSTGGRARLRAGEVGKFLNNPNKFVESIFQGAEAERKFMRFMNLGRGMDSALLMSWAKKQGFKTREAFELGMASSNWLSVDQKNIARRKFTDNSIMTGLMSMKGDAAVPKDLMKGVLRRLDETKGVDIIKNEGDMRRILGSVPGLAARSDFNKIVKDLYKKRDDSYASWGGKEVEGSIGGRAGYIEQLQRDYNIRARFVDRDSPEYDRLMKAHNALDMVLKFKGFNFGANTPDQARKAYGQTLNEIEKDIAFYTGRGDLAKASDLGRLRNKIELEYKNSSAYKGSLADRMVPWGNPIAGNFTKYKKTFFAQIDYKIKSLEWKASSESDPGKKFEYEFELASWKNKKEALKTLPGIEWRILLNDIDSARKAYQATFLDGGLAASIVSGGFFNMAVSGGMAPGMGSGRQVFGYNGFKSRTMDKLIGKLKDQIKEAEKITIKEVRDDLLAKLELQEKELNSAYSSLKVWAPNIVLPRPDISKGYAALTYLNYLTPGSLGRTFLYNGEGFVFLHQMRRMNFANNLSKSGKGKLLFEAFSDNEDFVEKFFKMNEQGHYEAINELSFTTNYLDFMNGIKGKEGKLGDLLKELDKFYSRDQNGGLARVMRIFGAPSLAMQRINTMYQVQVKDRVNRYLVDKVFRKFVGDEIANKVLIAGLGKMGLRQIIAATLTEVFAAIGSTFGPLGTFAGIVLSFAAEAIANKIIKPFVKLFFAFLWSFMVVLIAFTVWFVLLFFGSYPLPQQHIPPTDALECANGNPFKDTYNFIPVANAGNLPNAPAGSTCPIQSPIMYCTQGDGPGVSNYHSDYHGVDIGQTGLADPVWYAPTNGTIVSFTADNYCLDGGNYGGAMIFRGEGGIEYRLLHVTALASGQVSKGTPVAMIQTNLTANNCWTGAHFHLDVKVNGGYVDAEQWYKEELKCNISSTGTGCG